MIRGRVCRPECRDDSDNYYMLLVAVVHRAVLDSQIRPREYKDKRHAVLMQENRRTAAEFLALAQTDTRIP